MRLGPLGGFGVEVRIECERRDCHLRIWAKLERARFRFRRPKAVAVSETGGGRDKRSLERTDAPGFSQ